MFKYDYISIPFKPLGRDTTGCDCYGLVRLFLKEEYNTTLPIYNNPIDIFDSQNVANIISGNAPDILGEEVQTPEAGCIVLIDVQGVIAHVGVMVDAMHVLHTGKGYGTVIESLTTNKMKNRIRGFYNVNKNYSPN